MNTFFLGEVYDIIPTPTGIVFSYCKEKTKENIIIGYKMITFETGVMVDIAKNVYLMSKFGSNYAAASNLCANYITAKTILLPQSKVFVCSAKGDAYIVDSSGQTVWNGRFTYKDAAPSDIAVFEDSFVAAFKKYNALIKFNMNTFREELRIGGQVSPFNRPNSIFIENSSAFVASTGDKRIIKIDLKNFENEIYLRTKEPVYSYTKVKDYEFLLLKSGLYML